MEEGGGDFVVLGPVELEEAHAAAVGCGDRFDRAARGCAEDVGQPDFLGDFGDADFFVRVEDALDADGGDEEGGGERVSEEGGAQVAVSGRAEHPGDQFPLSEG